MDIKEILEVFEIAKETINRAAKYKVPLADPCWAFVSQAIDRLENEGLEI